MVLNNDPYSGGSHLPDMTLLTPVFDDDGVVGFTASRVHWPDVGGSAASSSVTDEIVKEGIRVPPVKIIREGTPDEGVWTLLSPMSVFQKIGLVISARKSRVMRRACSGSSSRSPAMGGRLSGRFLPKRKTTANAWSRRSSRRYQMAPTARSITWMATDTRKIQVMGISESRSRLRSAARSFISTSPARMDRRAGRSTRRSRSRHRFVTTRFWRWRAVRCRRTWRLPGGPYNGAGRHAGEPDLSGTGRSGQYRDLQPDRRCSARCFGASHARACGCRQLRLCWCLCTRRGRSRQWTAFRPYGDDWRRHGCIGAGPRH